MHATHYMLMGATVLLGIPSAAASATFTGLGDLPGGIFSSTPIAISANGSTAVGWSWSGSGREAFRWTHAEGMVGLGDLGTGGFGSSGNGVSADGAVVVGTGSDGESREAFRWTGATGMVGLGKLGENCGALGYCFFDSTAEATSSDGSVVVGVTSTIASPTAAYRWTESSGMVELPVGPFGLVTDVSGDGQVIVGAYGNGVVYRYSEAEGLLIFDATGVGSTGFAGVSAISDDGSTIVGYVSRTPSASAEAYRWTEEEGFELLGVLGAPADAFSNAHAASADGSVIVGTARGVDRTFQPFIWTPQMGIRSLEELLAQDYGLDPTGWELGQARDVSADGRTILGFGVNPDGHNEAWIAVLPEPTITVEIDIKPGSRSNRINVISRGVIPVVILGSDAFNVEDIDPTTLTFGPNGVAPRHALADPATVFDHLTDANNDGFTDLVTHYRTQEIGFDIENAEVCVSGELFDETLFEGCDNVEVFDTRSAGR